MTKLKRLLIGAALAVALMGIALRSGLFSTTASQASRQSVPQGTPTTVAQKPLVSEKSAPAKSAQGATSPAKTTWSKESGLIARIPAGYHAADMMRNVAGPDVAAIASAIDQVVGKSRASASERFAALALLARADIPAEQRERLLAYLADKERYRGMSHNDFHAFINNLLIPFHETKALDPRFLKVANEVIANTQEDEVIRDYVLQALSRSCSSATETETAGIRQTFWANITNEDTSLAGTAMLALNRLRREGRLSAEETDQLKTSVSSRITDVQLGERTRITAIQLAAELHLVGSIPDLVQITSAKSATSVEKVSALGALRALQAPDVKTLYQRASESSDPLLTRVASNTLQHLSK